jgi:hypothetical protein
MIMTNNFNGINLSHRPPYGMPIPDETFDPGIARMILVAMQNDLLPPIFFGQAPLQRMRVMIVAPGEPINFPPSAIVLPMIPSTSQKHEMIPLSPRRVAGDILRDHEGRLYEKTAIGIRPLHRLAPGPRGEILDLAPANFQPKIPLPPPAILDAGEKLNATEVTPADHREKKIEHAQVRSRPAVPQAFRKLLADPGLRRLVAWSDFKPMLAAQVAHPERLPETHRLPCYAQIYEIMSAQRIEALAAVALKPGQDRQQLQLLTEEMAGKLRLESMWEKRRRIPPPIRREPGVLFAHDWVLQLHLAKDPTIAEPRAAYKQPAANSKAVETPAATADPDLEKETARLKKSIPQQFLQAHEFQYSREEVLYDMRLENFSGNSRWRRLKILLKGRARLRKWNVLLSGRNLEEQLWAVRPPTGMLPQPEIRDWARQTLAQAGYDPQTMLPEWEIFWRRKGC